MNNPLLSSSLALGLFWMNVLSADVVDAGNLDIGGNAAIGGDAEIVGNLDAQGGTVFIGIDTDGGSQNEAFALEFDAPALPDPSTLSFIGYRPAFSWVWLSDAANTPVQKMLLDEAGVLTLSGTTQSSSEIVLDPDQSLIQVNGKRSF